MINGYIDESEDDTVFAMAGFVAPVEEWAKFSEAWDETFAASPSAKGVLKAKEIMRSPPRGAFWGMNDDQRDEKLRLLYSVIDAHVGYNVYSIVHLEPLKRLSAEYGFRKEAANPYYHAISEIIFGVAQIQLQQGITDEKIDWVFDERLKEQGQFLSIWGALLHDAPDQIKPLIGKMPIFRKDDELSPLQAADLEAWWTRLRETEKIKGLPRREYPWQPSDMPMCGGILDEEAAIKRFDQMNLMRDHLAILDPSGKYFS